MEAILEAIQKFEHHIVKRENELEIHQADQAKLSTKLEALKLEQANFLLKKVILDEASTEARQQAAEAIEEMGTNALQFVLGSDYSLKIELKNQAKGDIANIYVVQRDENGELIETEPSEEDGGGIADIVSMAMQFALLELANSGNAAPFFMDEPTKFVSKGYSDRVAQFISSMSHSFDRQIILVTHDEHLSNSGDIAYRVTRTGAGESQVEQVGKEEINLQEMMKEQMS